MNAERWKRIKDLHARARELPESERRPFLEHECAADADLLGELVLLLSGDSRDDFLETPNLEGLNAPQPRLHTQLGDYELLDVIGRGGMGVVYRARQKSLGREVAVKVLPRPSAMEQRRVDRFQREAQAAARLEHPAIVPIYSVGEDEGLHYFAMQYVVGRSLSEELHVLRDIHEGGSAEDHEKPILPAFDSKEYLTAACDLVQDVASGLQHAHEHGIVHRDVKPQNLLLDLKGQVHVADFGLAKVEELGTITKSGEIAGTPYYMSPEQALAKRVNVDHRTDIFSLGVVLYELLTLQRPFGGNTSHEVLYAISFNEPRAVRKENPRVPRDLETICIKALSKKPDQRYATAGELADDLQRFLSHEAIHAKRPSAASRIVSHVSRRRSWYAPLAASVAVLVLGSFFLMGWADRREVLARVRPLKDVVEAEDLSRWPIEDLVSANKEAQRLWEGGSLDHEWVDTALERIREVGYERKDLGMERLVRGLPSPEGTPIAEYVPGSDPDYFVGLRLLHEALLLLPEDTEVAYWANPRNTFPKLELVAAEGLEGAEVQLSSIDWWSSELGDFESLGTLPFDELRVIEPGSYRILLYQETEDGLQYVELTRALVQRGRTYRVYLPDLRPTAEVVEGMISVPEGDYLVGEPGSSMAQQAGRRVHLSSFWIDRTEVTNSEYRRFIEATGYSEPFYWRGVYPQEQGDWPVIGVNPADAQAYAEWAGKRLPTQYEWEAAMRGPDCQKYPWGNEPPGEGWSLVGQPGRVRDYWASYLEGVEPVGTHEKDVSPFGLVDGFGSVREWTETMSFNQAGDDLLLDPTSRIAKGNGWNDPAYRDLLGTSVCPIDGARFIGFRCAKSVINP